MKTSRVEFYKDAGKAWRWRLKAANGEIVASGEDHRSKRDAQRAFVAAARAVLAVLAAADLRVAPKRSGNKGKEKA